MEFRYIIENEKLFPHLPNELTLTNILNNYPLENENFKDTTRKDNKTRRDVLNEKIISHYYFREIGFETVPRFLFAFQRRMNEIMTLYNQRYKSIDLEINPIENVNMTETFTHTIDGIGKVISDNTGTNTGTVSNVSNADITNVIDNINVESDTPPTQLTDEDIQGNKYASRTSHSKNTSTNGTDSNNTQTLDTTNKVKGDINTTDNKTETYTRKEFGSSKGYTFAQNIEQWRNIMINVEDEIINELNDLFMNIW